MPKPCGLLGNQVEYVTHVLTTPQKRRKGAEIEAVSASDNIDESPRQEWIYKTGWLSGAELYLRYANCSNDDAEDSSNDENSRGGDQDVGDTSQDG